MFSTASIPPLLRSQCIQSPDSNVRTLLSLVKITQRSRLGQGERAEAKSASLWLYPADTAKWLSRSGCQLTGARGGRDNNWLVESNACLQHRHCYRKATIFNMGQQTTPSDAAPAYENIFDEHEHHVNAHPPGSASGYATVPQHEPDIELAQNHPAPSNSFTPHQHCETCDTLTTAREARANERHGCMWVSIVFMTLSVSLLLFGIVAVQARYKYGKD